MHNWLQRRSEWTARSIARSGFWLSRLASGYARLLAWMQLVRTVKKLVIFCTACPCNWLYLLISGYVTRENKIQLVTDILEIRNQLYL
ncbi:hypothetical protein F7734_43135 [Scytonema sp. UIC 10036]|uniref:hypothetical protein n=1 Tax=Scytonema sp. UIC 10036 TaxID=2304196 RepID=UPI0012DA1D0B|nr:hypothetical protein [Scytonema sp. UIC 10036]MUG98728.1 hypothetical protein [Scytonema sp. UIC 10036]